MLPLPIRSIPESMSQQQGLPFGSTPLAATCFIPRVMTHKSTGEWTALADQTIADIAALLAIMRDGTDEQAEK